MIISIAKHQALLANGAVATSQSGTPHIGSMGSPALGNPTKLVIAVETDAATTIDISVSFDDGGTWIPAVIDNTNTLAAIVIGGSGGSGMLTISPAPYVQLVSTNPCNLTAWAYTV